MTIKGFPVKVSSVSTSKTGKHGSAKCNFTAIDIFTGKKYEDIQPSSATVAIPIVVNKEYSLIDISEDGFLTLMDEEGNTREDIRLPEFPENFGREISQTFENAGDKNYSVAVLSAMGKDQVTAIREEKK
jgi:translation initiation factor 5A